jgi:hypothetical protein
MKRLTILACALVAFGLATSSSRADETKKPQAPAAAAPDMSMPRPGPEHDVLKGDVGTWDASVEIWMTPGGTPSVSKGVETNTMGPGGFWLLTDFKADMMGTPFAGHGTAGYDPIKAKYVSTWIDSMSPALNIGESTYDAATKTMTGTIDGLDMSGRPTKSKAVSQWKADGSRVFSMYSKGPDGKEALAMRITYTKKK